MKSVCKLVLIGAGGYCLVAVDWVGRKIGSSTPLHGNSSWENTKRLSWDLDMESIGISQPSNLPVETVDLVSNCWGFFSTICLLSSMCFTCGFFDLIRQDLIC